MRTGRVQARAGCLRGPQAGPIRHRPVGRLRGDAQSVFDAAHAVVRGGRVHRLARRRTRAQSGSMLEATGNLRERRGKHARGEGARVHGVARDELTWKNSS